MVMQTTCELSLLEVSSNVLVRHLLHASLEEIGFLYGVSGDYFWCSRTSYLFFRPRSVTTGRHLTSTEV